MSASLNEVKLIGNLGADPEVRNLTSGGRVVTFSVATTETWRDKNTGEKRSDTQWHRIVVWSESLGLIVENYLAKGSKVYVQGKLKNRSWEDSEGVTRYVTEIHLTPFNGQILFLDAKKDGGEPADGAFGRSDEPPARQAQKPRTTRGRGRKAQETVGAGTGGDIDDTDIPF